MDFTGSSGTPTHREHVGAHPPVPPTSAHQLIDMLLKGGLDRILRAQSCMRRGDARKGILISQAISILNGLRESLNLEAGGEIAQNLDDLYEYCQRRLLDANLGNDPAILDEVTSLLREISSAWDAISPIDGQVVSITKQKHDEQIQA